MPEVRTTKSLRADGLVTADLAKMVRSSELFRLRRGVYATGLDDELDRHRELVRATVPLLAEGGVVSHRSAALLHGLPLLGSPPRRVEVTRPAARGGKDRGGVHLHAAPLKDHEVVEQDGFKVTSLGRTVLDVARSASYEQAVVVGDAALRAGLTPAQLEVCVLAARGRPKISTARRVAGFIDGLSESPGESLSRIALARAGLLAPVLQHELFDLDGQLVARCDFAWPEQRTIGEFDGKVKYGRLLRPGEQAGDVVYREKLREDLVRGLGWQAVRWTWSDLDRFDPVAERLRRAFERGVASL